MLARDIDANALLLSRTFLWIRLGKYERLDHYDPSWAKIAWGPVESDDDPLIVSLKTFLSVVTYFLERRKQEQQEQTSSQPVRLGKKMVIPMNWMIAKL